MMRSQASRSCRVFSSPGGSSAPSLDLCRDASLIERWVLSCPSIMGGLLFTTEMQGLLLSGGPDVAPEFLHQPVPDPSILDTDMEPERDRWEFAATKDALERQLPIFAICKGMQLFNIALGGTLHLDIPGHNAPEMKE